MCCVIFLGKVVLITDVVNELNPRVTTHGVV